MMPKDNFISFPITRLNHTELEQFLSTSITVMDKTNTQLAEVPKIESLYTTLQTDLAVYGEALHQIQAVSNKDLVQADKKRGRAVRNLIIYVDICRDSPNLNKQTNAAELYDLVLPYKSLYKENYEKESAGIRSLLTRLDKSPYKEKLNQIGAREFIDNVRTSQQDFYQIYTSYYKHKKSEKTKNLVQQRESLIKNYGILYQYLLASASIDGESPAKDLLLALNDVRKDYLNRLKRLKKKDSKNNKE